MRLSIKMAIAYLVLVLMSIFWLLPFYIALVTSLKTHRETYVTNVLQPPSHIYLGAWIEAWNRVSRAFFNSIVVSISSTLLCVLIGSLGGYYLARFRFRGANALFFMIAVGAFIPYYVLLIPMTRLLASIGLFGTLPGLIIAYVILFSPWAALISSAFFLAIPRDFEEAAYVDGASPLQAFFRVVLPIALPGIVSTTIIVFMNIWNEFLFAVSLITDPTYRTIQPEIANLRGTTTVAWNTLMAGSLIGVLPPTIICLFLGRYFIRGLLAGTLRGAAR
ncbi:MAG: carbohydrate ABC transporter permease [Thermoprotei archaeon]|nr:MAG: carbohydrate ABC transporter permease [Thermoprotei archaeon]